MSLSGFRRNIAMALIAASSFSSSKVQVDGFVVVGERRSCANHVQTSGSFAKQQQHNGGNQQQNYFSTTLLRAELFSEGDSTHNLRHPGSSSNEWGIPHSSDLTPLVKKITKPISKILPNGGKITLVGSGPGDPDLLTVKALKLLTETVDGEEKLIIADRLVSPEILKLIPFEVKVARKLPGCAELAQEEIYWWAYQGLNQGKHVIRLKIGDPFVFGRGGEEVLTFRRFGVESTVIPGVSAAFSAPLLGAIPVTHRGVSNQVVMCTGYGREGTSPDLIRYHPEQTVVFLMAVGRLQELCDKLIEQAGYPSDTPVGIVEKAGCPDQRTVVGNMMTIADIAKEHQIKPPSTIVVGKVVGVLHDHDEETGEAMTGLLQNMTQGISF